MTVRINKQKINLREKLAEFEDKVNFDEVVRGLGEYTGNVGIGTASPQGPLHLYNSKSNACRLFLQNLSSSDYFDTCIYSQYSDLVFDAGRNPRMRITSTGNVGIGTANPDRNLVIDAGGNSSPVRLIARSTDEACAIQIRNSANTATVTQLGGNIDSYFAGGNVGIGTTDPQQLLHLAGQAPRVRLQDNNPTSDGIWDIINNNSVFILQHREADNTGIRNLFHILSNGNVGIGTSDPSSELHIHGNNSSSPKLIIDSGSVSYASSISFTADSERAKITGGYDTGGGGYMLFNTDTAGGTDVVRMRINNAGNVTIYSLAASADVVTNANQQLTTSSDKRLKNDLGDCEYGLNEILQVQPKKYTWKEGPEDQQSTVGFFAQDIYPIMPEAAPREAIQNENGEDDYKWGLNSQTIIAALVNATKEQQQIIEDLKSRIETLESK